MQGSTMRGILFDLDGVIYQGDRAIAGATDCIDWIRSKRIPYLFVTNTTSKPRSALCSKLAAMGLEVEIDRILSPPVAAAHWLQANIEGEIALFIPDVTLCEFNSFRLWQGDENQPVAAVIVGDLGEGWSFSRLNQAFRCLLKQPAPALVALGMTRYWQAADGLRLDTGPFVAALQYATGIEALVMGKPANAFFLAGAQALGLEPGQLVMIGDDIRGDVEGAQKAGLKGVLVKTGKFQPQDLDAGVKPDAVLDSIADLPGWWQ
jgi:HAD superfamily hydrolase (TIGR01458 family)